MTPAQYDAAAEMLFEAEQTGRQCGLLSLAYPGMTLDDAYAVQAQLIARKRRRRENRLEDRADQPGDGRTR